MTINTNNQPQLLNLPSLPAIHLKDPEVGKALQIIVDYINENVIPAQGTRVATRSTAPGGQTI